MRNKILEIVIISGIILFLIPALVGFIYFVIWPYFSAKQALSDLSNEINEIHIPQNTLLVSEYETTWCCGNGNHRETDLIVTKLYRSKLSKEEIRNFYRDVIGTQKISLVFVDEAIEDYPDRSVYLPCFPYKLFEGHNIPEKLPTDAVLFIIYGVGLHTDPRIAYCP